MCWLLSLQNTIKRSLINQLTSRCLYKINITPAKWRFNTGLVIVYLYLFYVNFVITLPLIFFIE